MVGIHLLQQRKQPLTCFACADRHPPSLSLRTSTQLSYLTRTTIRYQRGYLYVECRHPAKQPIAVSNVCGCWDNAPMGAKTKLDIETDQLHSARPAKPGRRWPQASSVQSRHPPAAMSQLDAALAAVSAQSELLRSNVDTLDSTWATKQSAALTESPPFFSSRTFRALRRWSRYPRASTRCRRSTRSRRQTVFNPRATAPQCPRTGHGAWTTVSGSWTSGLPAARVAAGWRQRGAGPGAGVSGGVAPIPDTEVDTGPGSTGCQSRRHRPTRRGRRSRTHRLRSPTSTLARSRSHSSWRGHRRRPRHHPDHLRRHHPEAANHRHIGTSTVTETAAPPPAPRHCPPPRPTPKPAGHGRQRTPSSPLALQPCPRRRFQRPSHAEQPGVQSCFHARRRSLRPGRRNLRGSNGSGY